MKRTLLIITIMFTLGLLQACNEDTGGITPVDTNTPSGKLVAASDCKSISTSIVDGILGSNESAVEYSYNATTRVLTLKHVNAGFNCCPGTLSVQVRREDNLITIIEKESEASCHCNCLYDLDIEISNLAQKSWSIVFTEPYLTSPDLPLSFVIDLATVSSGRHAVPRAMYPWGS